MYQRLLALVFHVGVSSMLVACPEQVAIDCATNPNLSTCLDQGGLDTIEDQRSEADTGADTKEVDTAEADAGFDVSCTPDCADKLCGSDGCGGFCGSCGAEMACSNGNCIDDECGQTGMALTGQFKVGQGVDFEAASVSVAHKMNTEALEDGCLTTVTIDLRKGLGCTLHIEAGTATGPAGGLRITDLEFAANSECSGLPSEAEGSYKDFSGLTLAVVQASGAAVADLNAPESCLTATVVVSLQGVLVDGDKTLTIDATTLTISGEFKSVGSTTASCPCKALCDAKTCGDDGCGFACGVCADNETCDAGVCQCSPSCDQKSCGDDGCGGNCGSCIGNEACNTANQCECTPDCNSKLCGDDGCGGSCDGCTGNETCNGAGSCACETLCEGTCCEAGQVCDNSLCCTPQCDGKSCGDDGCGGTCGTCLGNEICNADSQCMCIPDCNSKLCGDDGCGGSCGECTGNETCNGAGSCACETLCEGTCCEAGQVCDNSLCCTPQCDGKSCGDDGCGGTCGTCPGNKICDASGQCICGPNSCAEQCGYCALDDYCYGGVCEALPSCTLSDTLPPMLGSPIATQYKIEWSMLDTVEFSDSSHQAELHLIGSYYDPAGPTVFNLGMPHSFLDIGFRYRTGCPDNCTTFRTIGGVVTVTADGYGSGDTVSIALANLVLEEVEMDWWVPNSLIPTVIVPGGQVLCLDDFVITGLIQ